MQTQTYHFHKNQTWIHQKLKNHYLIKVGGIEEAIVQINGRKYRIDVLDKERTTAFEIHRSNFGARFSEKIKGLLQFSELKIVIVYPVVLTQKVTRMNQGSTIGISYYNKQGDIYALFEKLVYFKTEFIPQRMEFDVIFIKEHVLKEFVGFWGRSLRRRYKTVQRDLISIQKTKKFRTKTDFIQVLPFGLPSIFTNQDLAKRLELQGSTRRTHRIPGRITYALCKLGILSRVGTRGRAHEFSIRT